MTYYLFIYYYFDFRYVPSQVDLAVLEGFAKPPSDQTPHAKRWYSHISSFSDAEKKKLPGVKKVPAGFSVKGGSDACSLPPKSAPAKPADDDDVDLFGSDDEEVYTMYLQHS